MWIAITAIIAVLLAVAAFFLGITYRKRISEREISSAEEEAKRIVNEAIKTGESKQREALLEAKETIHKERTEYEREVKERRAELQKQERRLQQKEEALDKKTDSIEKKNETLNKKISEADALREEIKLIKHSELEMLEKISGYSQEEAKDYLLKEIEAEVIHDKAIKIKELEARYKEEADQKAREYITLAIQRCAADHDTCVQRRAIARHTKNRKSCHIHIIRNDNRNVARQSYIARHHKRLGIVYEDSRAIAHRQRAVNRACARNRASHRDRANPRARDVHRCICRNNEIVGGRLLGRECERTSGRYARSDSYRSNTVNVCIKNAAVGRIRRLEYTHIAIAVTPVRSDVPATRKTTDSIGCTAVP